MKIHEYGVGPALNNKIVWGVKYFFDGYFELYTKRSSIEPLEIIKYTKYIKRNTSSVTAKRK